MRSNSLFSKIVGVTLIVVCAFFLLLFVGIAMEFGLFTAWLYSMPLFLGVFVGFQVVRGKSLRLAVKAWVSFLLVTLIPFTAFISVLPPVFQVLSVSLIILALGIGLYVYRRNRLAKRINATDV